MKHNSFSRDTRDYKSRIEAYSREMLRKEAQIKDLQSRVENGDGSKFLFLNILSFLEAFYQNKCPNRTIFHFTLMIMVGMAMKNNLAKDKLEHINSVPRPTTPPFCSYLFFTSEIKLTLKTIYYSFHKFIDGLRIMLKNLCHSNSSSY